MARAAIAGEWKTETVLQHHLSAMLTDHILPEGEARDGYGILKKVALLLASFLAI